MVDWEEKKNFLSFLMTPGDLERHNPEAERSGKKNCSNEGRINFGNFLCGDEIVNIFIGVQIGKFARPLFASCAGLRI